MGLLDILVKLGAAPQEDAGLPPLVGRNEPCWCGSGKKYKKCHLQQDDLKRTKAKAAACCSGPT